MLVMEVKKNQTYKTPIGLFLKVTTVRESGLHTLSLIDHKGNPVEEKRNTRGHVIQRAQRICSDETIRSFKKVSLAVLLMLSSLGYSQKRFVRSEDSKHKVEMTEHLKTIVFDGRVYKIKDGNHKGWYRMRNDSITWVYGLNPENSRDVVLVGFYNEFKSYVISVKTEDR